MQYHKILYQKDIIHLERECVAALLLSDMITIISGSYVNAFSVFIVSINII
jgi:hypothetical protein